jgi:hypothetical protein
MPPIVVDCVCFPFVKEAWRTGRFTMELHTSKMSGVSHIKWYNSRYMLAAGLLAYVLFAYYFFSDTSLSDLGSFGDAFTDEHPEVYDGSNTTPPAASSATSISKTSQPFSSTYKLSKLYLNQLIIQMIFQWSNLLRLFDVQSLRS